MKLELSADDKAFCEELRQFVEETLAPQVRAKVRAGLHLDKADHLQWEHALARRGWLAYTWSRDDGGPGWTVLQQFLFEDITAALHCPTVTPFGVKMVGPLIRRFGSAAQQQRFLPGILHSTTWWCQGYSEPGAGSDLAALSTHAERRGDRYVVNGQKIWTSGAQRADWMFALVRTSRETRRQQGITFLLIDMRSRGIEVKPIVSLEGTRAFNSVFFTDVEVPVDQRIGEEGEGWTCAKHLLSHERLEVVSLPQVKLAMHGLRAALNDTSGGQPLRGDPAFAGPFVRLEVRLMALELRVIEVLDTLMAGGKLGAEISGLKIRATELSQDILQLTMEAAGHHALPWHGPGDGAESFAPPFARQAARNYLYRRAWSILGGTNEIQKNIMAKALLDM